MKLIPTKEYLLLVDEKVEIKYNTIIFESDTCLINIVGKDYIHNKTDFKIIAYYPLTEEAKELDLPLLPNPFEEEIDMISLLDKDIPSCWSSYGKGDGTMSQPEDYNRGHRDSWIKGYRAAAQSKQFSLEDMKKAHTLGIYYANAGFPRNKQYEIEFQQLLSTQQLPKEFIPEYLAGLVGSNEIWAEYPKELKTVINSDGKQCLVGTYKY